MSQALSTSDSIETMPIDLPENQWGYAKRLRFILGTIAAAFPQNSVSSLSVLDVGCGNGAYVALPLARAGFHVLGLDPHQDSIAHARELAGAMTNAKFTCEDIENIPSGIFEVVILSEVLEHVANPSELLKRCAGRLKPDGIVIVTVPNGYGEFEIDSWVYGKLRLQWLVDLLAKPDIQLLATTDNSSCGHVHFFTLRRIRRIFSECSLSVFRQGASSWLSGPIIGVTLARYPRFIAWNARVSEKLPMGLASGWYFALRRQPFSRAV